MMKYIRSNLKKLEDLCQAIGYKVRYEQGHFQSGYCRVEARQIIVINKLGNVINGGVSVNININNAFKSKSVNKNEIELKDSIKQLMEDISENNDEDVLTNAI